ncbi:hypothetical protein Tco_0798999 [Tanacetum coccineum]
MCLHELLLLAKMRSEFGLEIFVIEDTTCFLTVPPYSGRVFKGLWCVPLLWDMGRNSLMRRFPGGVYVGKLKCFPLTKLVVPDLHKWKSEKIAKLAYSRLSPNRLLKVEGDSHFDLHIIWVLLLKAFLL